MTSLWQKGKGFVRRGSYGILVGKKSRTSGETDERKCNSWQADVSWLYL